MNRNNHNLPEPSRPQLDQFSWGPEKHDEANGPYVPNHFSVAERGWNLFLAASLLIYGSLSLYIDYLHLPGRYTRSTYLHGTAAWLMVGAFVAAAAVMLALVVDHYDRRNNEHHYYWFKKGATWVGWALFASALVWGLVVGRPDS
jgi:hypothetical protein